jgi:hypothetical protein
MTHIAEATAIQSPPERSRAYLLDYVSRLPASHDGRAVMRLSAGQKPGGLRLEHDVEVELKPAHDETHLEYRVDVSWRPTGTTLLPSFAGVLRFQWDEQYGYTWLVIEGDYEPPLGAAGKAFDAIAGERIARGTMRALLDDLRAVLEAAHARELGKDKP